MRYRFRPVCSSEASSRSTVQNLNESFAELDVERGVYDWINGAVHVAQPRKGSVEFRWDLAVRVHDVCDEERQPADDEYA